jgi:hypothetical protein
MISGRYLAGISDDQARNGYVVGGLHCLREWDIRGAWIRDCMIVAVELHGLLIP